MNKLYYGDCLEIMAAMPPDSIDLIYLDPPFNSNRSYNTIYKDSTGQALPEQAEAFCDVWELTEERERAIADLPVLMRQHGMDDSTARLWELWIPALRHTQPRLLAYLSYMTERLLVMRSLLKATGSLYLHCDPTASHYIKMIMDVMFGHQNFQNEIVWHYSGWNAKLKSRFNARHDVIFYYSKTEKPAFDSYMIPWESEEEYIKTRKQKVHTDDDGRRYVLSDAGGGRRVQRYLNEAMQYGKPVDDVWDVDKINNSSKERLGYPTQKPIALLKRIIQASSNEGDIVLDPFCGCATTIAAAHELNRRWIGIDIAYHAITKVVRSRLHDQYGLSENIAYEIDGIPKTREAAIDLWNRDPYQFQRWAVEMVDGFVTTKRGHDGGVDGRIYFATDNKQHGSMILEVKGGEKVNPSVVRELRGTMEKDGCEMAGLIVRGPLGKTQARNFQREMGAAGFITIQGKALPRMQLLTVDEIVKNGKFNTPFAEGKGVRQKKMPFS